jgi:hypothetical protein
VRPREVDDAEPRAKGAAVKRSRLSIIRGVVREQALGATSPASYACAARRRMGSHGPCHGARRATFRVRA